MAKSKIFHELSVSLPGSSYPILIGRGFLSDKMLLSHYVPASQVVIISNTTLAPLYLSHLQDVFSDRQCDVLILPDGEEYKNQQSLFQIYDTLIAKQHHRDTTLITLGGGVLGDLVGFAASTYQRGVNFIQIPTTLLAQVDASVGGKTAINHPDGKNMIGSFYQPKAVFIDLDTLSSLPIRQFRAGLAEIIKYAILLGGDFLIEVEQAIDAGFSANTTQDFLNRVLQLPSIINQCCKIKADIVEQDERESGVRALLNLGHTVGHALEAYTHYTRWLHGEAVAIGLYCAALLSYQQVGLDKSSLNRIDALLHKAGLPSRIPQDINLEQLRLLMDKDKKIQNNRLRFVLVKNLGNCYLENNLKEDCLQDTLQCAVEEG